MLFNGKIIGVIIGSFTFGIAGAIVGLIIGHLFDTGLFDQVLQSFGVHRQNRYASQAQEIFFRASFLIMGYVAKSDGRVSEKEIQAARHVMARMGLSPDMQRQAIDFFNQGKQSGFDPAPVITELKQHCWRHPSLLKMFLEVQLKMANADGNMSPANRAALQQIYQHLGIAGFRFDQFEQRYRAGQQYQQHQRTYQQNPRQSINDAYQLLEISSSATDSEVTKAYRRQMSKNHPDKLMAKGLPPEMIKLANEKTQQIKSAYEMIKRVRGMS